MVMLNIALIGSFQGWKAVFYVLLVELSLVA